MSNDYEFTLYQKNEVHVYRIAPRPPQGHRAEDWKECIWCGKLKIIERSSGECVIRLEDCSDGKLFGNSFFKLNFEEVVERVVDSSRYFALRLDNGKGRHAYVGIGFESRNDAFDFNCVLSDFTRRRKQEVNHLKDSSITSLQKTLDLKLKEGEKIRVKLKGYSKPSNSKNSLTSSSSTTSSFSNLILPLPPPSKTRSSSISKNQNLFDNADFNDFVSAPSGSENVSTLFSASSSSLPSESYI